MKLKQAEGLSTFGISAHLSLQVALPYLIHINTCPGAAAVDVKLFIMMRQQEGK